MLPAPPPLAHSSVDKDPKKCTFGGSLNFVGIKSFSSFPCAKVRVEGTLPLGAWEPPHCC